MDPVAVTVKLSREPYWTGADQAELDVLTDAFVGGFFDHRQHCNICSAGGPWCPPLREAFQIVLNFRRERRLRSIATWLRARESAREWLADVKETSVREPAA